MLQSSSPQAPRSLGGSILEWTLARVPKCTGPVATGCVRCSAEGGSQFTIDAFLDGDTWRARFSTGVPGAWKCESPGFGETQFRVVPRGATERWPQGALRLSDDRRYLVDPTGKPFLYFADTAWAIVWKGTPDEWTRYLDLRAEQGFSALQVNLLPWHLDYADVDGNLPFVDGDFDRPNPAYFRRYDQFLTMAAERGLYVCLVLLWGGPSPELVASHFTPDQAAMFARYAVARFACFPVLWSLSADSPYVDELDKWETIGAAIEAADSFGHPTTNHVSTSMNWHFLFHGSKWHDLHMLQTNCYRHLDPDIASLPAAYFRSQPTKAIVNGEPCYEQSWDDSLRQFVQAAKPRGELGKGVTDTLRALAEEFGPRIAASEVRYAFWTSILCGATMGHTYGAEGIWDWTYNGEKYTHGQGILWADALAFPGALQCALGARFLRNLPWWRLEPCPERVQGDSPSSTFRRASCATIPGSLWLAYAPPGVQGLTLKGLERGKWPGRWFNPRSGEQLRSFHVETTLERTVHVQPPDQDDWVLIFTRDPRGAA